MNEHKRSVTGPVSVNSWLPRTSTDDSVDLKKLTYCRCDNSRDHSEPFIVLDHNDCFHYPRPQ
jgi:hypothetical protein